MVPFLMEEWDHEMNTAHGILPDRVASQSNTYAYWKCHYGHQWKAKISNRYHLRGCPQCHKVNKTSFPEQSIYFYVKQIFSDAVNSYKDIFFDGMELDIYIPSLRIGVEYDGSAWHQEQTLEREERKYRVCQKNSIQLYRVKEAVNYDYESSNIADWIISLRKPFSANRIGFRLLDDAIKTLVANLSAEELDINTQRDRKLILECYLAIQANQSLSHAYPEIARQWHPTQNGSLTPFMFSPHSNFSVWWLGDCGHEWDAPIALRTRGNDCPYCSGQRVLKGFNDLKTVYPDIAEQWHPSKNGDNSPDMFTSGSGHRAHWLCPTCKQEWESRINMRTSNKRGCPYCAHEKALKGVNDLVTVCPDLVKDWDYEKNLGLDPTALLPMSNKRVWWKCSLCNYEYRAIISNRYQGTGCKRCAGQILIPGENDLETLFPELAREWDYEKNGGVMPSQVFSHSNQKYFWKCKYNHSWAVAPNNRAYGTGCPVCSGNVVLEGFNDLATTHPEIAAEWHPTKNGELLPTQISKGCNRKIWFLCSKCNNAYDAFVGNKIKGYGKCPFCSTRKTRARCVVQVETGKTFKTLKEAALSVGKKGYRQIHMCCKGKCNTAHGLHWEYRDSQ